MEENPILDALEYTADTGALYYKGVRYMLIRPETIAAFQKAVEASWGSEAAEKLFAGGFAGGRLSAEKYKRLHNFSDDDIIAFMLAMGGHIGWGRFRLEQYDPAEKILRVRVDNSPFAEAFGVSSRGVCHLIRGVLAGMAVGLFETECTAREVECRSKGDDRCLFVVQAGKNRGGAR